MSRRRRSAIAPSIVWLVLSIAAACAAGCTASGETADGARQEPARDEPRVVRQLAIPLRAADPAQGSDAVFEAPGIRGVLGADGGWRLQADVPHPRLMCARYAVAVRFGTGHRDCSEFTAETPSMLGPQRRQCNGATLIHSSRGTLSLSAAEQRRLNCAEITVRCRGACG